VGRIALLANPESGSGEAEEAERELRALGADVEMVPIADAERVRGSGAERIAVAGGDGSIGLAARLAADEGIPLAVIPVGTANDFARALDLPEDLTEAARLAAEGGRTRRLEVGLMSGEEDGGERPFVNVASLGLPPEAAQRAHGLKRVLGPLAYAVGAVRAAATADPVECRVVRDGGEPLFAGRVWQATVACSGHFGAGSQVRADPGDGLLDAVVVEARSRIALARRAQGMRNGTLEDQPGVHRARDASFRVEVEDGTGFNVDGELCVRSGTVNFKVAAEPVEVVVG
jgi:diacylglycerol kinase (ATP)